MGLRIENSWCSMFRYVLEGSGVFLRAHQTHAVKHHNINTNFYILLLIKSND